MGSGGLLPLDKVRSALLWRRSVTVALYIHKNIRLLCELYGARDSHAHALFSHLLIYISASLCGLSNHKRFIEWEADGNVRPVWIALDAMAENKENAAFLL